MVRGFLRGAHGGAGAGLAGHRGGRAHAHLRAHRAAARRWPRSCGASTACSWRSRPADPLRPAAGPLRVAAQGARPRRRPQPARTAGGHRAWPPSDWGTTTRRGPRRHAHRRHARRRATRLRPAAAGHPRHDAGVAVPDAHVGRPARRCAACAGSSSTRSTPWPAPSAAPTWRSRSSAWRPSRRSTAAAHRPLRHAATAVRGGGLPGRPASAATRRRTPASPARPVTIVDAGVRKAARAPGRRARRRTWAGSARPSRSRRRPAARPRPGRSAPRIWPSIYPRILELIRAHRSTIVFTNSRRLAERLALNLNELAGEDLVAGAPRLDRARAAAAHRGEPQGRAGCRPSWPPRSLELGIDMGAVDLVIQVESPLSVARGLQRVGRAGHQVGEPSRGVIFPKYRGDLLEAAVVTRLMHEGAIEPTVVPAQPARRARPAARGHDASSGPGRSDELYALVRRAENYAELGRDAFEATLGMLAGQYPGRRVRGAAAARRLGPRGRHGPGAPRRAHGGRHLRRHHPGPRPLPGLPRRRTPLPADAGPGTRARAARSGGRRVGELDEEMVYEAREGEVVLLGASAWRIESIEHDRVLVTPAPGEPGKVPFWKGDGVGRPVELGRALGAFTREIGRARGVRARAAGAGSDARLAGAPRPRRRWRPPTCSPTWTRSSAATGALPTDRTIVLQRFRDELGDWRVCLLTPVRRPRPCALGAGHRGPPARARSASRCSPSGPTTASSSACRPRTAEEAPAASRPGRRRRTAWRRRRRRAALAAAAEAAVLIAVGRGRGAGRSARSGGSALFASRFRENAARALLLPRRRPGQRTPLWQMRQRASQLLAVASRYGSFPIILETYRECLQRRLRPARAARPSWRPSSGARSASSASRRRAPRPSRARCCSTTSPPTCTRATRRCSTGAPRRWRSTATCCASCWARSSCASCSTATPSPSWSWSSRRSTASSARPASADAVHDLLRRLGDLSAEEVAARVRGADDGARGRAAGRVAGGARRRPACRARCASPGERALDRASRMPAATATRVGVAPAAGACRRPSWRRPRMRWAACWRAGRARHGPFLHGRAGGALAAAARRRRDRRWSGSWPPGALLRGEFRPGGVEREWCDPEVLRLLRRRSLARLRREIEPVEPAALARFLPAWQGVGSGVGGPRPTGRGHRPAGGPAAAGQRARARRPAGARARLPPAACSTSWAPRARSSGSGAGSLGRDDGRIALYRPDRLALLLPERRGDPGPG